VPGLNGFLGLSYVKPIYASSGLFVIPWIFIFDEFSEMDSDSSEKFKCDIV